MAQFILPTQLSKHAKTGNIPQLNVSEVQIKLLPIVGLKYGKGSVVTLSRVDEIMMKEAIQTAIQVFLFSFFSSAWGACETEIERAIQADADYAAPQIESMKRSNPGSRVEAVSERKNKKREMWNAIVNEYKTGGREVAAAKLRSWTESLSRYDRSSSNLGSQSAVADALANICLANATLNQTTSSSNQAFNSQPSQQQQAGANQPQPSNLTQQAQQSAQQTQARADQQRQGQRKTHDRAAEAHECIAIDKAGSGNYGAFKNQCPYPVNFYSCNEKPRTIQGGFNWSADFDCSKQQLGLYTPKGNSSVAAHNRNTEFVHWFACKAPATPADAAYVPGKGIEARCYN